MDNSNSENQMKESQHQNQSKAVEGNGTSSDSSSAGGVNQKKKEEAPSLEAELAAKVEEIKNLNDKYLRLAAEFENYKRRVQREQSETIRFANEKLLKELLPTLDNLERAIACGRQQSDSQGLLEGVELTYKQFLDTLEKLGVKQVTSVGEPFDPAKHQAVGQVESATVAENCVVDEYQKGYFLQERILRPAMVTVSKSAGEDKSSTEQQEKQD